MSLYYQGASVLLLALMAFILVPVLLLRRRKSHHNAEVSNPEIVKQRLSELDSEKRESLLSESDFTDAVLETKLHLAEELAVESGNQVAKATSNINIALVGMIIFGLSGFVYYQVNHIDAVVNWQDAQSKVPEMGQRIVVNADTSVTREELMNFALGLRTKLATQKDDPVGWLLLGRVLSTLRDFDGAILAFNKSLEIQPDRVGALFSLAQTLLVTDSETNILRAEKLLLKLRQLSPEDNSVMALLAVAYTRQGNEPKAIKIWKMLQQKLVPNDPMMATVNQQLAQLIPETVVPERAAPSESTLDQATQLVVKVNLAAEVADKLPASGFLFVYIQDADSGMRMPAAVKKQSLSGLDLSKGVAVTLTNADSMLQEFNLSNITNGRLIARISLDENVAQQEGDLEGELLVPVVQGEKAEHQLFINKEI